VSLGVKNTFVDICFVDAYSAGLRRSSSCPSLGVVNASPREDVNSQDDVSASASHDSNMTLSRLGCWADAGSDSDEQEPPSCLSLVGLSGFSFTGEIYNPSKVDEMSPAVRESVLDQTPASTRTPLSSKASAFNPLIDSSAPHVPFVQASSLNSKASAFAPCSSQMVSMPAQATEFPEAPVLGNPSKAFPGPRAVTTVMLRNLPSSFTRNALLYMLDNEGFAGTYDFLYVPFDFHRKLCKGFALVNLISAEHLQRFVEVFEGYSKLSSCSSSKVCQTSQSHTQGLRANIERFQNSPVMSDAVPDMFKPALYVGKREVPFPGPTRALPQVSQKSRSQ